MGEMRRKLTEMLSEERDRCSRRRLVIQRKLKIGKEGVFV
jgi:hypothetical protein